MAFLFLLGSLSMLTWGLASAMKGPSLLGDGYDPATYGFDMTSLAVDPSHIVASGNSRDFLLPYLNPQHASGNNVSGLNASRKRSWQKEVVSSDRVIGVSINGESRAYPLFIVNAHEIILDELGGVPIAVTYSPLIDAVGVYKRQQDGEVIDFGVSGLLLDGSLLFYDRRDESESNTLYEQISGTAILGPRVGTSLERIPGVVIQRWDLWLEDHPESTVILRDPGSLGRYKRISYERYFDGNSWLVTPRGEIPRGAKDRMLGVRERGTQDWVLLDLERLREGTNDTLAIERLIGETPLRIELPSGFGRINTVRILEGQDLEFLPSLRISWVHRPHLLDP
jgi:hypothetical protein